MTAVVLKISAQCTEDERNANESAETIEHLQLL